MRLRNPVIAAKKVSKYRHAHRNACVPTALFQLDPRFPAIITTPQPRGSCLGDFARNAAEGHQPPRTQEPGKQFQATRILIGLLAILLCATADGSWLKHVPDADRQRANPYVGQAGAIAAGGRLFADHCAQCHGTDALGRGKRPSLRSDRVQHATDGEIFWLLKNGNLSRGMPTWAALPEQSRWQIIAYVKSLGLSAPEQQSKQQQSQETQTQ